MNRKLSACFLVPLAMVLGLAVPSSATATEDPPDPISASYDATVESVKGLDELEENGRSFRPRDELHRLLIVKLRLDGVGILPVAPNFFGLMVQGEGGPRTIASTAIGIYGTSESGTTGRFWAETKPGGASTLRFNLAEGESLEMFVLFEVPRDMESFRLGVPRWLPEPVNGP